MLVYAVRQDAVGEVMATYPYVDSLRCVECEEDYFVYVVHGNGVEFAGFLALLQEKIDAGHGDDHNLLALLCDGKHVNPTELITKPKE